MKKRITAIALALTLVIAAVFAIYAGDYYKAEPEALAALESGGSVTVSRTDAGYIFDGPGADALIFYPGGKVEHTAYAPLMRRLAENGLDAILVKMPFRLAILAPFRARSIEGAPDGGRLFIGGHSRGGVCAALYASTSPDRFDGVILLAAYPVKELGVETLFVVGSNDGVLNREKYEKKKSLAAASTEIIIEGGNHAGFGSYGAQSGDGEASITPAE